jgi:hypothetical protein
MFKEWGGTPFEIANTRLCVFKGADGDHRSIGRGRRSFHDDHGDEMKRDGAKEWG